MYSCMPWATVEGAIQQEQGLQSSAPSRDGPSRCSTHEPAGAGEGSGEWGTDPTNNATCERGLRQFSPGISGAPWGRRRPGGLYQ